MPLYDYMCRSCAHRFELRQGFDADTMTDCPKCGQLADRQISLVPVIFKGSGWYVNDYGKKKSTLGNGSGSDDDGPSSGGGDSHGHSHGDGGHSHSHSHGGHSHDHGAPAAASSESSGSDG